MRRADFAEAERCFRMLASGASADGVAIERYMNCLYVQYKTDTATRYLSRKIKKHRQSQWLKIWRARFQVLAGNLDGAAADLRSLIDANPNHAPLHQNLGHVYRAFGRLDKAANHYQKAFADDPSLADSYRLAIECTQQRELKAQDEKLLSELEAGRRQHPDFYFGLANIFDRLGDVDRAWFLFESGNRLVRSQWSSNAKTLVVSGQRLLDWSSRFLTDNKSWAGPHADQVVLVSGFPRSGTTMLESVIASDDRFAACGELASGANAATRLLAELSDSSQERSAEEYIADFGGNYLSAQRRLVKPGRIGVDKATDQFRHAQLLLAACPNARMIQIKRDPQDVILSNFKSRFTSKALAFSFSIPGIVAYLDWAMRAMNHWQDLFPESRVKTISYDDYVKNPDTGNTRLTEFLNFDDVSPVFSFSRKREAVITASSTQLGDRVRQDSSGKSAAYEKHLDPWRKEIDKLYELL